MEPRATKMIAAVRTARAKVRLAAAEKAKCVALANSPSVYVFLHIGLHRGDGGQALLGEGGGGGKRILGGARQAAAPGGHR